MGIVPVCFRGLPGAGSRIDLAIVDPGRTPAFPTVGVDKVISGNTEIKDALTQLSTYTGTLGHTLAPAGPRTFPSLRRRSFGRLAST